MADGSMSERGAVIGAMGAVTYLGPAHVAAVGASDVEVILPNGSPARAAPAFALPYEPAVGDMLLIIGGPGGHYAIGVLAGRGRTQVAVPGDLDLHAVGGRLRLAGDAGVEVEGKRFEVLADKVKITADQVVEKCGALYQRVTGLLSVHVKQRHTVIDGESHEKSRRAVVLTEETMTLNGKQIHLG